LCGLFYINLRLGFEIPNETAEAVIREVRRSEAKKPKALSLHPSQKKATRRKDGSFSFT
jgi:hypothetical protein